MATDLLAELPPAVQDRARAWLTAQPWLGELVEVRTTPDGDGLRVTLICAGGAVEFISEGR